MTAPDSIFLHRLRNELQNELLHQFSRDSSGADQPIVFGSSLLVAKVGVTLAFLQSLGTSPLLYDLSKMDSGLSVTIARLWVHAIRAQGFVGVRLV